MNCIIDRRKSTFTDELALNQIVDNMVRGNLSHYEPAKAFKELTGEIMADTELQPLPLGTSAFSELRANDQIYVDKTALIFK